MFQEVDSIAVECDGVIRRIVLAKGNLARIDPAQEVDLLVVSAIAGDYTPTPTSLVGQLTAQGIPVEHLARSPARDLRDVMGAWLSHPVETGGFKRLVGFEPGWIGSPPKAISQLFRALFPFLDGKEDQVIAMPLLSTGDAGWSADAMMPPLLEAAVEWLKLGLPVKTLYIVIRDDNQLGALQGHVRNRNAQLARERNAFMAQGGNVERLDREPQATQAPSGTPRRRAWIGVTAGVVLAALAGFAAYPVFVPFSRPSIQFYPELFGGLVVLVAVALVLFWWRWMGRRSARSGSGDPFAPGPAPPSQTGKVPDDEAQATGRRVFLSFSSRDAHAASHIRTVLEAASVPITVFDFRRDIPVGVSYQREIDAAMKDAHRVVCLLTPDYLDSPECEEELMVARLRNKRQGFKYLWPVYWRAVEGDLQDWLMILNLSDCREEDHASLTAALDELGLSLVT